MPRLPPDIEGSITSDMFHDLTKYKVSDERLRELINNGSISGFKLNGAYILDLGSVRRWLLGVHPETFESVRRDLFWCLDVHPI
jgi:hypothetical protein